MAKDRVEINFFNMKKLKSLKNPLFNTLEGNEMKSIKGGKTWTLAEVVITRPPGGGDPDSKDGAPAQWDN